MLDLLVIMDDWPQRKVRAIANQPKDIRFTDMLEVCWFLLVYPFKLIHVRKQDNASSVNFVHHSQQEVEVVIIKSSSSRQRRFPLIINKVQFLIRALAGPALEYDLSHGLSESFGDSGDG